jgi:hypothetical protein
VGLPDPGTLPTGELEVLLVAIKGDIVEGLFRSTGSAGLRLQLVDVSPATLCNSFRYNYPDLEGCTMLLDIGAKTSNVLFFEKGKYSSRGINIGANSITQDFAAESRMPFAKAEQFKIAEGFVSLGGAYEEPENPQQAQISKVARQVMTRLHIQVNQTIQFYRGQQGGSAPVRVLLAGGASIMPYTAQFFSEKLNLPVEYFNPLRNVQIDPAVNLEELAKVAHSLGEVVGLGLRNMAQCPIELNLMPKSIRKRQQLNQKKPYFAATVLSLVVALGTLGWFYDTRILAAKREALSQLTAKTEPLQKLWDESINPALQQMDQLRQEAGQVTTWVEDRVYWIKLLEELRLSLIETENRTEARLGRDRGASRVGVWIERMAPVIPGQEEDSNADDNANEIKAAPGSGMSKQMRERYGIKDEPVAPAEADAPPPSTNEIVSVVLTCTAINLLSHGPKENVNLIATFEQILKNQTNLFVPEATLSAEKFTLPATNAPTFNFEMTLKLRLPMKI